MGGRMTHGGGLVKRLCLCCVQTAMGQRGATTMPLCSSSSSSLQETFWAQPESFGPLFAFFVCAKRRRGSFASSSFFSPHPSLVPSSPPPPPPRPTRTTTTLLTFLSSSLPRAPIQPCLPFPPHTPLCLLIGREERTRWWTVLPAESCGLIWRLLGRQ